jgi:hypothetical protein
MAESSVSLNIYLYVFRRRTRESKHPSPPFNTRVQPAKKHILTKHQHNVKANETKIHKLLQKKHTHSKCQLDILKC